MLAGVPFFAVGLAYGQLTPAQKDDIGLTALQSRLGSGAPDGSGISATQVEASVSATPLIYRPDAGQFSGKTFQYPSGGSATPSGHATTVGQYFYGSSAVAPGIGDSPEEIRVFEANDFIGSGFLRNGNNQLLPAVESNDIQNHSWVGELSSTASNVEATRRLDFAIQRDDYVATIGLNNGSGTAVPSLLAGSFNGITVGRSDGNHSQGGTMLDGGLRTRPDLVVPVGATSWGTPTVGGAASLLLESARSTPGSGNAERSFVVKSLLMTGASRTEPEFAGGWSNTTSSPLDPVYGAGELDVDRSHRIFEGGEQNAAGAAVVASTGWDEGQASATVPQTYFFDLSPGSTSFQVAASLVWNRDVEAVDNGNFFSPDYTFDATLADLNLRLFTANGFTLGTEVAASLSGTQNVELIDVMGLAAGRYAWQVTSDTAGKEYGLSWYAEGLEPIPESSTGFLVVMGSLLAFRRRRRS